MIDPRFQRCVSSWLRSRGRFRNVCMGYSVFVTFRASRDLPFRTEHFKFTRSKPPLGFTSRGWPGERVPHPDCSAPGEWEGAVERFLSGLDHLYKTTEPDRPQAHSRTSSRASSISEGHVSPEDDGPSKKILHRDFGQLRVDKAL